MSVRIATAAAQRIVKTTKPELVVDGIWGRRSEGAFIAAPPAVQAAAEKASEDLGYKLAKIRDAAVGKLDPSIGGNGFDLVLREARKAGIEGKALLYFMTTLQAESQFINRTERGYTHAGALREFGSRMASLTSNRNASAEDIANTVYARSGGNYLPGDGWKYRGRGYIQLTGRGNYSAFQMASGHPVLEYPDLISQNDEIAAQASIWYWKTRVQARGMDRDMLSATLAVNGTRSKKSAERIAMLPQVARAIA